MEPMTDHGLLPGTLADLEYGNVDELLMTFDRMDLPCCLWTMIKVSLIS